MNCTTITVQWQQDSEDTATIQGYKLYYKEEGQQENGPILLGASDLEYTVSGLGEYLRYFLTALEHSEVKGHPGDLKSLDLWGSSGGLAIYFPSRKLCKPEWCCCSPEMCVAQHLDDQTL